MKDRPQQETETLLTDALRLLKDLQGFKKYEEYSSANMNMKKVCNEVWSMVVKEITEDNG